LPEDSARKELLIPLATVITPNLPEAATLLDLDLPSQKIDQDKMLTMCAELASLSAQAILLKGGHLSADDSNDLLYLCESQQSHWLNAERVKTKNTHGTGCSLSSAIASYLAQGESIEDAARKAKTYIHQAITHADELTIGSGHGPIHHFFKTV